MADEGVSITMDPSMNLDECMIWCGDTDGCNSFIWSEDWGCYLKDKCVTMDDPSSTGSTNGFKSYYKRCKGSGMMAKINV